MINGRIALWLGLAAALLIVDGANAAPPVQPKACTNAGKICPGSTCLSSITAAQATVPYEACPAGGESQDSVDIFSWNEFIAFNWPATQACVPDTTKSILDIKPGNQGPVVWQTQMSSDDLFVAPGASPAAWCSGKSLAALFAKQPIDLSHTAQTAAPPQSLDRLASVISEPTDVEAVRGVITDQAGRWLRFERLTNQTEYTAIVNNNWYRLSVLNGPPPKPPLLSLTLPPKSVEFKSAWKILTPGEIASGRYYTIQAVVYNTPDGQKSPGANPVTLGLVGLHIIQKTQRPGGFFWSTFEQVDNEKVFFNPHGKGPTNTQTAQKPYTELDKNAKPINAPVQIKRLHKIAADPALNAYYQKLLAGSVFAHYRLISTQWQTGIVVQGEPPYVANIVIETYVQNAKSKPQAASAFPADFFPPPPGHPAVGASATQSTGCLACHINATAKNGKTVTDHSFLFLEAQ
jgi:hypothetical protein